MLKILGTSINSALSSNLLEMESPQKRHVYMIHSFFRYLCRQRLRVAQSVGLCCFRRALLPKRVNRVALMLFSRLRQEMLNGCG